MPEAVVFGKLGGDATKKKYEAMGKWKERCRELGKLGAKARWGKTEKEAGEMADYQGETDEQGNEDN